MAVLFLLAFTWIFLNYTEGLEENCTDINGIPIRHGLIYVPGPNICTMCVCYHNGPKWCKTMFCSGPPYLCKEYKVGEKCCQFECLDPPTEKPLSLKDLKKMSSASRQDRNYLRTIIALFTTLKVPALIDASAQIEDDIKPNLIDDTTSFFITPNSNAWFRM